MDLNNRELATLFWFSVLFAFAVAMPSVRPSIGSLAKQFLSPKMLVPFLALVAYSCAAVAAGHAVGIWNSALLTDTVIWFLAVASVLFFNVNKAMSEKGYYRRTAIRTIEVTALIQFVANLYPLSFVAEVLLQGVLAVAAMVHAFASSSKDPAHRPVARLFQVLLIAGGLLLLVASMLQTIVGWGSIDFVALTRKFAAPVWLTLALLPFIYSFALVAAYEKAFIRMKISVPAGTPSHRGRLALLLKARLRLRKVVLARPPFLRNMAVADSLRGSLREYDLMVEGLHDEMQAEQERTARLERFAGVVGVDDQGRQLDQREFEATKDALRWLATCQMGQYRARNGSYRPDQLEIMGDFSKQGLPDDHGIAMQVSGDGQSWWAWRRAPIGWVFGIGASGAPPDQWFYEGDRPPVKPPGRDWRHVMDPSPAPSSHWG